jgi:small neutral amino acid transporter SnatA (MarC family)
VLTVAELLAARPAVLPYFVVPFPVPITVGPLTLTLVIVLGRN